MQLGRDLRVGAAAADGARDLALASRQGLELGPGAAAADRRVPVARHERDQAPGDSAPAIVLYFALPAAWAALGSIPFLNDAAQWLDTTRTTDAMIERLLTGEEWLQFATSQGLWVALPLAIGLWRIAKGEIRAA